MKLQRTVLNLQMEGRLFYINSRIQMLALNSCNQHMNHAGHHLLIHLKTDEIFHVTRSTHAPPQPLPTKSVQNILGHSLRHSSPKCKAISGDEMKDGTAGSGLGHWFIVACQNHAP